MSRRRSTGDLVPRDITEILAREARAQRGHRKSGSSLGQAFSWFKGSKRKKSVSNGLNRPAVGGTDARTGVQSHDPAKAGPKTTEEQKRLSVHYTVSQHYQENVFIEGSRPQYLEDLHSEAQEGLKILQEEHRNGVSFPDDESIASTNTLQPEQDISSKDEDGCPESGSTTGNTDTTVSSARPVLTRQGSTFKPLNPVKSIDRNKKRSRRTTIMGIPNQVQKELALRRHSTFQQLPENNNTSDSQSGVVIIPTVDGENPVANKEGARVHLSELEVSKEEKLLQKHLQAMYQDEQHFTFQDFGHVGRTSMLRPKSVAVPGMTSSLSSPSTIFSFLQESQGPVMSISPQATYMSTIIPNAVLPASVEVIEIDHGLIQRRAGSVNHGSVRTMSKSSLGSADSPVSPLLSRRSYMETSQTDTSQNNSTLISTSASNLSESSKTVVLISSPASSKRSTCSGDSKRLSLSGQGNQQDQIDEDQDLVSLRSSVSIVSSPTSTSEQTVASEDIDTFTSQCAAEDKKNKRRSLSVTKTKQPPAPPRRTNSLYSNKIKNSKVLVESEIINEAMSRHVGTVMEKDASKAPVSVSKCPQAIDNGGTPPKSEASASSPHKITLDEGKFERTISPSSGYSSQSGTPTLSPKEFSPTSPDKQKKTPLKPERCVSRTSSSVGSPSSSLTSLSSGTSESVNQDVSTPTIPSKDLTTTSPNISSAITMEIKGLLNIPAPPKVRAPCSPPPEAWAHNGRSVELLCGSYGKVNQATQSQDGSMKQAGTQTEELPVEEKIGKDEVEGSESMEHVFEGQTKITVSASTSENHIIQDSVEDGANVLTKDTEINLNKVLPVVTVTTEEQLSAEEQPKTSPSSTSETHSPDEDPTNLSQNKVSTIDTLTIDVPKFNKDSPPPTPPPAYHPTPPLSRRTPPSVLSLPPIDLQKVQEESYVAESCWPPPPPPLEGDSAFEGSDETDFPLPPPPPLTIDMPDKGITDQNIVNMSIVASKEDIIRSTEARTSIHGQMLETSATLLQPVVDIAMKKGTPRQTDTLADFSKLDNATTILSSSLKCDSLKAADLNCSEHNVQPSCPVPVAPPIVPENQSSAVNFRRQPSTANRGKEFLSRHKSMPIPKEDANIPLVTPSLLQMVRLRSVSMAEEQESTPSEDKTMNVESMLQESSPVAIQTPQSIPQKPVRKSLSIKSSPQTSSAPVNPPSLRLQEAIRMKTAAMSTREGLLSRPGVRLPPYNCIGEPGATMSLKLPEGIDMQKSPASTASFIFSRSNKKVVIDTVGHSPEAQMTLKQNLAAELLQVSEQSKANAYTNGGIKSVPPPVAKKPAQTPPVKMDFGVKNQIPPLETKTTRLTADTIETLF